MITLVQYIKLKHQTTMQIRANLQIQYKYTMIIAMTQIRSWIGVIGVVLSLSGCSVKVVETQPVSNSSYASLSTVSQSTHSSDLPPVVNSGWKQFASDRSGISFQYPTDALIDVASGTNNQVAIKVGNYNESDYSKKYNLSIVWYPNAPFYNPPAGVDVREWVVHNKNYPMTFDSVREPMTISGLQAFHGVLAGGEGGIGQDMLYVIKNNRLYQISISSISKKNAQINQTEATILNTIRLR